MHDDKDPLRAQIAELLDRMCGDGQVRPTGEEPRATSDDLITARQRLSSRRQLVRAINGLVSELGAERLLDLRLRSYHDAGSVAELETAELASCLLWLSNLRQAVSAPAGVSGGSL